MRWCLSYLGLLFGRPRRASATSASTGFVLLVAYDYGAFVTPFVTVDLHAIAYIAVNVVAYLVVMLLLGWAWVTWLHRRRYGAIYVNHLMLWLSVLLGATLALEPAHDPLNAAPVALAGLVFYCVAVAALLTEHTHDQYQAAKWHKTRVREQRRGVLEERVDWRRERAPRRRVAQRTRWPSRRLL